MNRINYKDINGKGIIIDVQSPHEYNLYHLSGARNIPYDVLIENHRTLLNKYGVYYIYCKAGHLSKRAVSILSYLGYNCYVLEK
ncbi:MAG: rhodanese-like domain-containing protein [Bacilli bacterium]